MITIDARSMDNLGLILEAFPERAKRAMALAINQTTKRQAATMIRKDMLEQVAFTRAYVLKNTTIHAYANVNNLEATITGRDRPTMLSRFMTSTLKQGQRQNGVKVAVKPSSQIHIQKAFAVKLRSGNIGVMLRTNNGNRPHSITAGGGVYVNKIRAWLLYAPSVEQVMQGVAVNRIDEITEYLKKEFFRQFARLK